jgi:hypothetical protein
MPLQFLPPLPPMRNRLTTALFELAPATAEDSFRLCLRRKTSHAPEPSRRKLRMTCRCGEFLTKYHRDEVGNVGGACRW